MKKPLDTKELRVGIRVRKISGERQNAIGLVKAINVQENTFAVLFEGYGEITSECDPKEFEIITHTS